MKRFKITYIDEDTDDIELFQEFAYQKFFINTINVKNDDDLYDIVDEILNSKPDAVVTDYLLSEKARVKFNGQAVIEEIQRRNTHLPCYLLTSHAPDALQVTHDARLVQAKSIPFGGVEMEELKTLFLTQIDKTIETARNKYDRALLEYESLCAIDQKVLTAPQKERLIELDNFLDSHGFSSSPIPTILKEDRHIELLTKLLENIDKILEEKK